MYKENLAKDPSMTMKQLKKYISKYMGVGESTVDRIIHIYKQTNSVIPPKRKKIRETFRDSFDELSRNTIRRHVHGIWLRREIPTVDKIHEAVSGDKSLPPISRTNLYRLLKDLGFRYTKGTRHRALTEKSKIVLQRRRYLENIQKYREEGRRIYYVDETLVNAGVCFVAFHIGSEDGFVPGGLLCRELIKNPRDCRDEINGEEFREWMERVLPLLADDSVIVMDNVAYHTVKIDKVPTMDDKKEDIIKWLEDKGEVIERPLLYVELMQMVKRIKPLHKKYIIDELVKANQKTILRLPRNHRELNPLVLAWSSVKDYVSTNISSCKLADAKNLIIEGINRLNAEMWKNFISRTMEEEKKCYEVDYIVDDLLDADLDEELAAKITGDTSSSDIETDSC